MFCVWGIGASLIRGVRRQMRQWWLSLLIIGQAPNPGVAQTREDLLPQIESAQQVWAANSPSNYSYTLQSSGVFGGTIYRITVVNGVCTARSKSTRRNSVLKRDVCPDHTIQSLFDELRESIAHPWIRVLALEFDPVFGYPRRFDLDSASAEDQQWWVSIEDFRVRESRAGR